METGDTATTWAYLTISAPSQAGAALGGCDGGAGAAIITFWLALAIPVRARWVILAPSMRSR